MQPARLRSQQDGRILPRYDGTKSQSQFRCKINNEPSGLPATATEEKLQFLWQGMDQRAWLISQHDF